MPNRDRRSSFTRPSNFDSKIQKLSHPFDYHQYSRTPTRIGEGYTFETSQIDERNSYTHAEICDALRQKNQTPVEYKTSLNYLNMTKMTETSIGYVNDMN